MKKIHSGNVDPAEDLEGLHGSLSVGGDSNAIIMTGSRRNKKKVKTQSHDNYRVNESKNISNSRKRKLKKLEEDKEKEQLRLKSLETLEKYKLSQDAYSLLWSSRNLGQADTMKEKRRRSTQFSKAGLEVLYGDMLIKRKATGPSETVSEDQESKPTILSPEQTIPRPSLLNVASKYGTSGIDTKEQSNGGGSDRNEPPYVHTMWEDVANEDEHIPSLESSGTPHISHSYVDEKSSITEDKVGDDKRISASLADQAGTSSPNGDRSAPIVVHVSRPKEVEESRKDLPIVMMEQEIMEAINENISVIICGETGCGKTTQVPQFLFEAGFGSNLSSMRSGVIGVTQPRRVAVLATAKRVAFELNLRLGKEVGFQIRYDKRIGQNCAIKFMTDGILLREVQSEFLLKRYSVIILDEAHERSLNTDILIGMLSRIIQQRQIIYEEQLQKINSGEEVKAECRIFPLKLILMSATLRVEDFTSGKRIFSNPPPIIKVPTRQFEVTVHFSKRTELIDYLGQAYKKVMAIHKRLPPGGILVFVTGQREVEYLCRRLRKASNELMKKTRVGNAGGELHKGTEINNIDGYDMKEIEEALGTHSYSTQQQSNRFSRYDNCESEMDTDVSDASDNFETDTELGSESSDEDLGDSHISEPEFNHGKVLLDSNLDGLKASFEALARNPTAMTEEDGRQMSQTTSEELSNKSSLKGKLKRDRENGLSIGPMHVLPLYAMLPAAAQFRVFAKGRQGERLVVIATNVAETSLTIPGITYVVDTGREKVKNYNSSSGIESYEIQWISKASAAQRAGRAGRTGPGHCYRLYSSAVFNNQFSDFSLAEISKIPVDGVVLLMKSMGISKVANFPFPTPPDPMALAEAERCLKALDALDSKGRMTPLGMTMALYPMSPRHSRMLLTAVQIMKKEKRFVRPNLVLGYAVASAAALSLPNPFVQRFEGILKDADDTTCVEASDFSGCSSHTGPEMSIKKKLKAAARASRATFCNLRSDVLTVANALKCFEASENPSEFCNHNALHVKTMEEMSKLRKQLLQLVIDQRSSDVQEFLWTYGTKEDVESAWSEPLDNNPLSQIEEDLLCQSICAGWADRVAKRIRSSSELLRRDGKVNAVRYQACLVKEIVFLHRWSSLSKSAPEFLVYSELLHTKRPYIHGATSVGSEWLVKYAGSLCTFSAPLEDPKPSYDHIVDRVFCHVTPYFGPHLWQLPHHKVPIKDCQQRVAAFAYALLDGQVLPCLKSVRDFMAAQPRSILRPEASGQKRVGNLLSKLKTWSRTIDSCSMLREVWKINPSDLYLEIRDWFQSRFHGQFEELWQTMLHEALSPDAHFPPTSKKKNKQKV